MDTAAIFSVILKQAPYLMFSLLGLGMVLLGSTGKFGKSEIDPKDRVTFKRIGWVIFWLFLVLAVVEIILPGKTKEFVTFLAVTFSSMSTLVLLLVLGLCFAFLYFGIPYVKKMLAEKGYKIHTIPVPDPENKEIYIQVENIGKGNFRCSARLVKITKELKEGKTENVEIGDIYPKSPYLGWTQGSQYETLYMEHPKTITLITGNTHSVPDGLYGQNRRQVYTGSFIFSEYGKSKSIDNGIYTVVVNFTRWNGFQYEKLEVFSAKFEINSRGVKWIKK